jgi:hypothetical protein
VRALQLHQARRPARVPLMAAEVARGAHAGADAPTATATGGGLFDALMAGLSPAPHAAAGLGRRAVLASYALRESALQVLARRLAPYAAAAAGAGGGAPLPLLLTDVAPPSTADGSPPAADHAGAGAAPAAVGYLLLVPLHAATAAYGRHVRAQQVQQQHAAGAGGEAQPARPFLPPGVCWRVGDQPLACVRLSALPLPPPAAAVAAAADGGGTHSGIGTASAAGGYAVAVADVHGQCADVFTVAGPLPPAALREPARVIGRLVATAGATGSEDEDADTAGDNTHAAAVAAAAWSPHGALAVRHVARAERGLTLARVTSLVFTSAHDALALQSDHGTTHLFPLPPLGPPVPSAVTEAAAPRRRRPLAVVRAFAKLRPRVPRAFAPSVVTAVPVGGAAAGESSTGTAAPSAPAPHRGVIGAVADAVVTAAASTHAAAAAGAPAPPRYELTVVAGSGGGHGAGGTGAAAATAAAAADDTLVVVDARGLLYAYQLTRQQQRQQQPAAATVGHAVVARAVPLDDASGAAPAATGQQPTSQAAVAVTTAAAGGGGREEEEELTVFAPREVPPSPTAGVLAVDDTAGTPPPPQQRSSPPPWSVTPLTDYYPPLLPTLQTGAASGGGFVLQPGRQQMTPPTTAAVTSPTPAASADDGGVDVLDRVAGWLTGSASWARRTLTGAGAVAGGAVAHAAGAVKSLLLTTAAAAAAAATAASDAPAQPGAGTLSSSDAHAPPPPYVATMLCAVDLRRSADWPDVLHAQALLLAPLAPLPPAQTGGTDCRMPPPLPHLGRTAPCEFAADAVDVATAAPLTPAPGSPPPTAPPLTEGDTHAAVMALSALHPAAVHRAAAQLAASGLSAVSGGRGRPHRTLSAAGAEDVDDATQSGNGDEDDDDNDERVLEAALSRAQAEALVRELHGGGSGTSDGSDDHSAALTQAADRTPVVASGHAIMFVTASPYAPPPPPPPSQPRIDGKGVGEDAGGDGEE